MRWWWLTFRDSVAGKVRDLGTVIVQAETLNAAVVEARIKRIHPGGEAEGFAIPKDKAEIPEAWRNKLLNPANNKALGDWTARMWGKR